MNLEKIVDSQDLTALSNDELLKQFREAVLLNVVNPHGEYPGDLEAEHKLATRILYNLKHELLRRLQGWQDIALYLADCQAATAEHYAMRKGSSKSEKKRHHDICVTALNGINVGDLVGAKPSKKPFVSERLAKVIEDLRK